MKRLYSLAMAFAIPIALVAQLPAASEWALWNAYSARYCSGGRIVDHGRKGVTTSEGQAYALFFALVANDQKRFEEILHWTDVNLAGGKLGIRLPAWLWGQHQTSAWKVLDPNAASDADLWMSYTLIQAGRLWGRADYRALGIELAKTIAREEVVEIAGFGVTMLPGPTGFHQSADTYQLNPSYLPLQILLGIAEQDPEGPWKKIAFRVPDLVKGSSPSGFPLDWIAYRKDIGWATQPVPVPVLLGSYDAIRVYLWAGMLDTQTPGSAGLLAALQGMAAYLQENKYPPAEVTPGGKIRNKQGSVGFSAAVAPYLERINESSLADLNRKRLQGAYDPATGLFGSTPAYYDQNLALFSTGWTERRFSFDTAGRLLVSWRP